ncbi:MAG: single-stranded DNA-binding protein [Anaerolineae bacterium]|jgi:single-strand DNA-binding protein|nr:single-stranded DNA-binding protein [Anaerolineae bacterium]
MSYQKLIIVGNLGRDPEMRYMSDGTPVTSFSIATSRKWTGQDGSPVEETTWFRVSAWNKTAEIAAKYLTKGRQVMVEGVLTPDKATGGPRIWTGQDGAARASFEVKADRVVLLGSRADAGAPSEDVAAEPAADYQADEDIPF